MTVLETPQRGRGRVKGWRKPEEYVWGSAEKHEIVGSSREPCLMLWRRVIAQQVEDAIGGPPREREDARRWLLSGSRDFHLACHLADVDPEAVMDRARGYAERGWRTVAELQAFLGR